jgi:hypothetical protein
MLSITALNLRDITLPCVLVRSTVYVYTLVATPRVTDPTTHIECTLSGDSSVLYLDYVTFKRCDSSIYLNIVFFNVTHYER